MLKKVKPFAKKIRLSHCGTLRLSRFILKRDWLNILIWLVGLTFFTVLVPAVLGNMFETDLERQVMAETMSNPAMAAMMGIVYGADNYTTGAMTSNFMLVFLCIGAAVMNIFFVVRHTRRDEESGRAEVIHSLPVGKLSNLASAMLIAFLMNLALALISGFSLFIIGDQSMTLNGSLLFGAAMGMSGLFFAAASAAIAQLTQSARTAAAFSLGFMGLMYLLRAAGDLFSEPLACISPLGLLLRTQAFVNNYWWPVFAVSGITLIVATAAFCLNAVRDLGEGLIPSRPGRSRASKALLSPAGLSLRLLRTPIIAWLFIVFALGAAYGSILGELEAFLSSSELLKAMFAGNDELPLAEQFITTILSMTAIIGSVPVITFALKIQSEEKHNRLEHLLGRAVSRTKIMGGYIIIAFASSILIFFLAASGFWISARVVMDNPISLWTFLGGQMTYLPAVWVMTGLTFLLIGFIPKAANAVWGYLGYSFFILYFGDILQLPVWIRKLTPYGFISKYPVESINWLSFAILCVIAAVLTATGIIGYRKRDMQTA